MKITCPACSASYNIDSSRVPSNGMTMRCPKCSHSFRVESDGAVSADAPRVGSNTLLDSGGQALLGERYYVKRQTGKVFGPFDVGAVQMMLRTGKLGSDSEVSLDKEVWTPIADMAEFASHVGAPALPSIGGDPKATMMGGWTSREGVPAPTDDLFDLPALKGGGDLPALKGGFDLPALKGGGDLPALKGGFDLPALKGGGDLPALKGLDLPASKGGFALPAPKVSDLPVLKGLNLPVSKMPNPPASRPNPPGQEDDLFGSGIANAKDDDDLFGAPSKGDKEDLFGVSRNQDSFGAPASHTKPQVGGQDDDLFGAPIPSKPAPFSDDNDLFGSPKKKDEDLFSQSSTSSKHQDDDFLGGDAGFSFLDDSPQDEEDVFGGGDIFGNDPSESKVAPRNVASSTSAASRDSWGDELLDRKPKASTSAHKVDLSAGADEPFVPKASGASAPEPVAAKVGREQAADEDRKRGPMLIGGVALALAAVGAIGYGMWTMLSKTTTVETPMVATVNDVVIDLKSVSSDNYSDLTKVLDGAASGNVSGDESARLLVVQSLLLARYEDKNVLAEAEKRSLGFKDATGGYPALARGAFEASQGNADAARAYLEPLLAGDGELLFFANVFMGIGDVKGIERELASGEVPAVVVPAAVPVENPEQAEEPVAKEPVALAEEPVAEEPVAEEPVAEEPVAELGLPETKRSEHPMSPRARLALISASDLRTDSPLGPYWLARLEKINGKSDEAISQWEKALKASPTHVASHVELGSVQEVRGNLVDALPHVEKVNGELNAFAHPSERAEALHVAGMIYKGQRQSDLAIEAFTKALTVNPARPSTLRAIASEYEATKKYREALNFFTTNKNLGQKEPEVMLGIVRAHTGLEQWSAAIDQLEEGQKTFPQDARFPFYLGRLNLDRGDFLLAQKAYERAVEIDSKLLLAHTALAKLSWRVDKDILRGEDYIGKVVEHADLIDAEVAADVAEYYTVSNRRGTAEQWYKEALRRDPNFWEARLSLSKLLLEEQKHNEARQLLEKARDEGVQDVRLSAYLADAYRQNGNYDRAIDEVNKVIEKFPKNEEYVYIRGRIHFDRKNYDTAMKDFQKAYDINPRYHRAYFYVGRTAFEEGDAATALKIFRHVLDYEPNLGIHRYYMGRALQVEGRDSQALDEYRKATAVDPAYGLENPSIFIHRGRLLLRLGYSAEGRRDIAKALEIAPEMVEALMEMADSSYAEKAYDSAITNYKRALDREPEHAQAQYRLGMALLYTNKQREGAQRLQLAIKYGLKDPEVYRTLGYLYKDLGQRKQALESFQTYVQETKDQQIPLGVRREMLQQIEELGG